LIAFVAAVDNTIVASAAPSIGHELEISTIQLQAIALGSMVSFAVLLLGVSGVVFFPPLVHQDWLGVSPTAASLPLMLVAVAVIAGVPLGPIPVHDNPVYDNAVHNAAWGTQ